MLPFMKHKPAAVGIMTIARKPDEGKEESPDDAGLMAAANDLTNAIHTKDIKSVLAALKAVFELMESMPHEEAPHPESNEGQE